MALALGMLGAGRAEAQRFRPAPQKPREEPAFVLPVDPTLAPAVQLQRMSEQLHALQVQYEAVDRTLPIVTLIAGSATFLLGFAGYQMSGMCALGTSGCPNRDAIELTMIGIGLGGVAVACVGLLWLIERNMVRAKLQRNIDSARLQLQRRFDLTPYWQPEQAGLRAQLRL